jgi:hypothetical protein
LLESKIYAGFRGGARKKIPALRLADRGAEQPLRARNCRMRLDDKPLVRVEKLHKNRKCSRDILYESPVF